MVKKVIAILLMLLLLCSLILPTSALDVEGKTVSRTADGFKFDTPSIKEVPIKHEDQVANINLNNSTQNTKIFGDIDSDGFVKASDMLRLLRSLSYDNVAINSTFSDVNVDGNVDTLDLVTLQRHMAGWDDYASLPYGKEVYIGKEDYMPDILYYEPTEYNYFYNQLTDQQKVFYNTICEAIEAHNGNLLHSNLSSLSEVMLCYFAVRWDHPEYYWVSQQYKYTSSAPYSIRIQYSFSKSQVEKMNIDIKDSLQDIVDYVGDTDYSEYELELMIHDYLVNKISYNHDAANSEDISTYPYAWNVYGGLVSNFCACEGYAESFMLCLKMFGINAGVATGSYHMWNFVEIDGEYYYADPTWSDQENFINYKYFNITFAEADLAHPFYDDYSNADTYYIMSGNFNYNLPKATATKY